MGGPSVHHLWLRPIPWAYGLITIQSMDDFGRLQGRYPENFVFISQLEVCQEGGSRRGVLGGRWGFLTEHMEDRVIPDVMNHVFLPKGRYPEDFMPISQLELCQEGGPRMGVLGGRWGFLTGDMEDRVIPDVMNDVYLSQRRYPENFELISQLEVCQKGRGKEGWYLEDVWGS